ncbi:hypothetical protein, partial [Bradyrhizobium brasilense]|uniref:hypothetical protein n=1 Tax=Bradyrhizobium brasilense TaxID=1419277 RepID=UPI001AEEF532
RHPGDIIPEWWATSSRNGWATSNRNGGRDHLGILGDIDRNQQAGFIDREHASGPNQDTGLGCRRDKAPLRPSARKR